MILGPSPSARISARPHWSATAMIGSPWKLRSLMTLLQSPFFGRPVTNLPPQGRANGLGWPASGVGGRAVKKRLALAFIALGLTPAASPAAELAVAPLSR